MRRVWPILTLLLGATAAFLYWQNLGLRHQSPQAAPAAAAKPVDKPAPEPAAARDAKRALEDVLPAADTDDAGDDPEPPPPQRHWLVEFFTPHPGENLVAYRDRVLPVVQAAALPQRKRVARQRQEFEAAAHLDDKQRAELDAAVSDAGDAMKDRIMQGVLSGEVLPPHVKPSTAVAFARDLLDDADKANQRFRGSLSPDQLAALDSSPFDVVDYLFFSTRWEDMLGVTDP